MKKVLTISLIILAIFGGLAFFRFLATTKNVLEINLFSKESGLAQNLGVSKLYNSESFDFTQGGLIESALNFSSSSLRGEKEGEINILILGEGGANHPGGNLTDTILVGSISLENSKPKKATLFSIPRDFYARIPNSNVWTKINAVKSYQGIDSLKSLVEEIMGLPIHYWLGLNFDQFVEIIDVLGGLSIYVEKDIYDPLFPGPNYSYQPFRLSQGWHYLDGQTALKYIRSRHSSGGDFDRTYRQQQVLEALRIKLNSPKSFLDIKLISTLFNTFTSHLKTNIEFSEMGRFYTLANQVWPSLIENKIIDISVSGLLTGKDHPTAGSILVPKAGMGKYEEIRDWVKGLVHEDEP